MKVVKEVPPPHPCMALLWDFYNTQVNQDGKATLGIGSIVQCDCGIPYVLSDSQRDGKFWVRHVGVLSAPTNKGWLETEGAG